MLHKLSVQGVSFRRINDPMERCWAQLMAIYEAVFRDGEKELPTCLEAHFASEESEKAGRHVVLAALDTPGNCLGGIIFCYLHAVNCGYISYLMVAPHAQRRGVGTALFRAARVVLHRNARRFGHAHAGGVFTELERESPLEPESYGRLRFWERLGVRPLDMEWEYPELAPGRMPVAMYLAYGPFATDRSWTPKALASVITSIFAATYSHLPGATAVLTRLRRHLEAWDPNRPIVYKNAGTHWPEGVGR